MTKTDPTGPCGTTWSLDTPRGVHGAIATFSLHSEDPDRLIHSLDLAPLEVGIVALRSILNIDDGLAARPNEHTLLLFPHAGAEVTRSIAHALTQRGITERSDADVQRRYPEADSPVEAHMLAALAEAPSPLAVDLLLDQPRRWRDNPEPAATADHAVLRRLLRPPLVVAVGPPNIGKSSLLNAIAGRSVALAFDAPGVTTDHVGVSLDLAGLTVHYLDTAGVSGGSGPHPQQAEIRSSAHTPLRSLLDAADLILSVCDHTTGPVALSAAAPTIQVLTRSDLAPEPGPGDTAAIRTSAVTGEGLPELAAAIRESLVPTPALEDPNPWRFWD